MKILITLLAITISMSSVARASAKSELAEALIKAAVRTMDDEKLVFKFNEALMTSRKKALTTGSEGSDILLAGDLVDESRFIIEVVSTAHESQIGRVALRLSSNTKNPAIFSDMFLTLKSGPGMVRAGEKGEKVGVLVVDTKNLSEVNERLGIFLSKAKKNAFKTSMINEPAPVLTRSGNVVPFNRGSK